MTVHGAMLHKQFVIWTDDIIKYRICPFLQMIIENNYFDKEINMCLRKIIIALLAVLIFTTCTRLTKEDWLLRYKDLVDRVQTEHMSFTEKDWQKADEEFNRINNTLKNRFKSELTNEDKITMHIYDMRYNFYRNTSGVIRKITDYIENDFRNDMDDVIRQGKRLFSDIINNFFGSCSNSSNTGID